MQRQPCEGIFLEESLLGRGDMLSQFLDGEGRFVGQRIIRTIIFLENDCLYFFNVVTGIARWHLVVYTSDNLSRTDIYACRVRV